MFKGTGTDTLRADWSTLLVPETIRNIYQDNDYLEQQDYAEYRRKAMQIQEPDDFPDASNSSSQNSDSNYNITVTTGYIPKQEILSKKKSLRFAKMENQFSRYNTIARPTKSPPKKAGAGKLSQSNAPYRSNLADRSMSHGDLSVLMAMNNLH